MGKATNIINKHDETKYIVSTLNRRVISPNYGYTEIESGIYKNMFGKPLIVFHSMANSGITIEQLHDSVVNIAEEADLSNITSSIQQYFTNPVPTDEIGSLIGKIKHAYIFDVKTLESGNTSKQKCMACGYTDAEVGSDLCVQCKVASGDIKRERISDEIVESLLKRSDTVPKLPTEIDNGAWRTEPSTDAQKTWLYNLGVSRGMLQRLNKGQTSDLRYLLQNKDKGN